MHRCNKPILVLVLLVSFALKASAGEYIVLGAGTQLCPVYLEAYEKKDWQHVMNSVWVSGYLTAVNEYTGYGKNVSAAMSAVARERWLHSYCESHGDETLHNAASSLLQYLLQQQDNP